MQNSKLLTKPGPMFKLIAGSVYIYYPFKRSKLSNTATNSKFSLN